MKGTKGKYEVINRLLHDEYVIVQINPGLEGVILPDHLMKEKSVSLKLSKLFSGGMEITSEKIIANLSFNQKYFSCNIPLSSIWSATSVINETVVWPESASLEFLKSFTEQGMQSEKKIEKVKTKPETSHEKSSKPFLKRIK